VAGQPAIRTGLAYDAGESRHGARVRQQTADAGRTCGSGCERHDWHFIFSFCFAFFQAPLFSLEPGRGEPGRCLWVMFLGVPGVGFAAVRNDAL